MPRAKKTNRSDGRYELKRVIGYTADGEKIRKSFYGANKDEALLKYHEYLSEAERREAEKKQTSFSSWVEKWLYTYKEPDVKPTTFLSTYKRPCYNYIIPYFKDKNIQDITQIEIKAFFNTISDRSQSLMDKILICLNGIFESAIDNDLIGKNPCRNVNTRSKAKKATKRTYDKESTELLCTSDHKYAIFVHILLRMGLRCSELCGLRWKDIDTEKGFMTVSQALTSEGSQIFIDIPKTKMSLRKLAIPEDLLKRLKSQKQDMLSIGQYKEEMFLAVMPSGNHITPNHFGDRQLEAFYNYMDVPRDQRLSPHELRHTCGTLLYKETKDIYHVSRFLGHSDIAITTKTYVHSEMQEEEIHINRQ